MEGKTKSASGDCKPTHDQLYLAERINGDAPKGRLSPAALQKLNGVFGTVEVTDVLRLVRGFSPDVDKPFAYVRRILQQRAIVTWNSQVDSNFIDPRVPTTISRKWK